MGAEDDNPTKDGNGNIVSTATNTRQIIGVAAGSADTDAVNVAQLKAVNAGLWKVAASSTRMPGHVARHTHPRETVSAFSSFFLR